MKKNHIISALIFMLLFTFSCEEILDVEPKNNLSEAQYYKTQEHAIQTITACYDPMKHPGGFNINFFFVFTTFSDHSVHEAKAIENFSFSTSENRVKEIWTYLFKGVYRTNMALEKIPPIKMDENLKTRLLAEAHFLRALYYFYLTTVYNEPPLLEEPVEDLNIEMENASRAEILQLIEEDLDFAINNLPVQYDDANVGRATKGAALALMGRTYMYYGMFAEARPCLMQVKDLADQGIYGLMMPQANDSLDYCYAYQCNFSAIDLSSPNATYDSENNKESIFEIQFEEGGWEVWEGGWQADGSLTCLYYGPDGYKNLAPTTGYRDEFETAPVTHPAGLQYDPRRYVMFYEPGDTIYYLPDTGREPVAWDNNTNMNTAISQGFGWAKYFNPSWISNNGPTNLKLMRYADVLLLLAEAEYQVNGDTQLARDCINAIRERAGLDPVTAVTPGTIIHERSIELGFEWHRFFDLVRWSQLDDPWVDIEALIPKFQKEKNEYLPIPLYEINLSNGKLKQNPGW